MRPDMWGLIPRVRQRKRERDFQDFQENDINCFVLTLPALFIIKVKTFLSISFEKLFKFEFFLFFYFFTNFY